MFSYSQKTNNLLIVWIFNYMIGNTIYLPEKFVKFAKFFQAFSSYHYHIYLYIMQDSHADRYSACGLVFSNSLSHKSLYFLKQYLR